ncbi:N-terminal acetyltransferase [Massospora cicadina]|nr:N-terminal acetyltransferase [Massospora cicadina]
MPVGDKLPPPTLETLTSILDHHLTTIPFGNLSMTPSTRGASVHAIDSFHKLVTRHRDGTWGKTTFWGTTSSPPYPGSFSLKKKAGYSIAPLNHLVIIVKLNGRRYLVDSGTRWIRSPPSPLSNLAKEGGPREASRQQGAPRCTVTPDGKQKSNPPCSFAAASVGSAYQGKVAPAVRSP